MDKKEIKKLGKFASAFCDYKNQNQSDRYENEYIASIRVINNQIDMLRRQLDFIANDLYKHGNLVRKKANLKKETVDVFLDSLRYEVSFCKRALDKNLDRLDKHFGTLIDDLSDLKSHNRCSRNSFKDVYEELVALKEEFGDNFDCDFSEKWISVISNPITLTDKNGDDTDLGRFQVFINLFAPRNDILEVVALEPYPCSKDKSITHPHVSAKHLCEGEATEAIGIAFAEGRFTDLVQIVFSILNTYNPKSPYVPLEQWTQFFDCVECGERMSEDDYNTCDRCGDIFCRECLNYCSCHDDYFCFQHSTSCSHRRCDEYVCTNCATECCDCGKSFCESHIEKCSDCGKSFCEDCRSSCYCCGDIICKECTESCSKCGYDCCANCLNKCGVCGEKLCEDCENKCESCEDIFCNDHIGKCDICESEICKTCTKECKECEASGCSKCMEKDCNCGKNHCVDCSKCKGETNEYTESIA